MLKFFADSLAGHSRTRLFWRLALLLLLCVGTWLALVPAPPRQATLGWDKLNHAVAFAMLAALGALGFAHARVRIALALLAYGALIEVLQSFTPTRTAEWLDLLADVLGIAAGMLLTRVLSGVVLRRRI